MNNHSFETQTQRAKQKIAHLKYRSIKTWPSKDLDHGLSKGGKCRQPVFILFHEPFL
jgi:hypothetical protein